MGLWKPTPKDHFKSRWKRFYKRNYRLRSQTNAPDRPGPHAQPRYNPDGVPSPWKLLYSTENYPGNELPPDIRPFRITHYAQNERRFLLPMENCRGGAAQDVVLRTLDPSSRRGGADSGYGRPETAPWGDKQPEHMPEHIVNIIKSAHETQGGAVDDNDQDFLQLLLGSVAESKTVHTFPLRRLRQLVEEWEIVWENGQNNPRAASKKTNTLEGGPDRGRFPFIDEQAGLLDELTLKDILRLNYKTKSRHHPKWREIRYDMKRGHRQYLRRKQMNDDEAKARMGVIRQALASA